MRVRSLLIWIVRSLLSMALFSIIFFSIADFDASSSINDLLGDIYEYSDPESREHTFNNLNTICETVIVSQDQVFQYREICEDPSALGKVTENCNQYFTLRSRKLIDQDVELEESCTQVLSGILQRRCDQIKDAPEIDTKNLSVICQLHLNGTMTDKTFFKTFLVSALPTSDLPTFNLQYFLAPAGIAALLLFLLLLVLHKRDAHELLFSLGHVLFNLGIMLTLLYTIVATYTMLNRPDTSVIMQSIGSQNSDIITKAIPILAPLIIQRVFTIHFLLLGLILMSVGLTLKVLFHKSST